MRVDGFFVETEEPITRTDDPWSTGPADPWSPTTRTVLHFDHQVVSKLRHSPIARRSDTEVVVALCQLVHEELEAYGTNGDGQKLNEEEIVTAIRALVAVTKRMGRGLRAAVSELLIVP